MYGPFLNVSVDRLTLERITISTRTAQCYASSDVLSSYPGDRRRTTEINQEQTEDQTHEPKIGCPPPPQLSIGLNRSYSICLQSNGHIVTENIKFNIFSFLFRRKKWITNIQQPNNARNINV